jgi:hypothetical protein
VFDCTALLADVGEGEALGVLDSLLSKAMESALRCAGRGVVVAGAEVSTVLYRERAECRAEVGMFSLLEMADLEACADIDGEFTCDNNVLLVDLSHSWPSVVEVAWASRSRIWSMVQREREGTAGVDSSSEAALKS